MYCDTLCSSFRAAPIINVKLHVQLFKLDILGARCLSSIKIIFEMAILL
jgi:hypothetical protein